LQGRAYKASLRLIAQNVGRGERAAPRSSEYSRFAALGRSQDDAIGSKFHARKRCNFAKSAAILKKHEQARFSMSVSGGLNIRCRFRSQTRRC
jgi:hypothetical protein